VVGTTDLGWRDIYILLELIGGKRGIPGKGWASGAEVTAIQETANSYRHATTKLSRVHRIVPLLEARARVKAMVVAWLAERAT
jgi:hypothetical protein